MRRQTSPTETKHRLMSTSNRTLGGRFSGRSPPRARTSSSGSNQSLDPECFDHSSGPATPGTPQVSACVMHACVCLRARACVCVPGDENNDYEAERRARIQRNKDAMEQLGLVRKPPPPPPRPAARKPRARAESIGSEDTSDSDSEYRARQEEECEPLHPIECASSRRAARRVAALRVTSYCVEP